MASHVGCVVALTVIRHVRSGSRLCGKAAVSSAQELVSVAVSGDRGPFRPGSPRSATAGRAWRPPVSDCRLAITDKPAKRWPGLAVGADVPAADPVHRGLERFVAVCMACHRFAGEGEGTQGPDLARPMNPVDYFQPAALRKFLRDPRSVRAWAEEKMPAFGEESLPDSDIDAIVAWLAYKAGKR